MSKVLVIVVNTGYGLQQEIYPGNTSVEEKGNFVRIFDKADKSILGLYPTEKIIGARFFTQEELIKMANKAQAQEPKGAEPLHPSDGAEGQQDSPNR